MLITKQTVAFQCVSTWHPGRNLFDRAQVSLLNLHDKPLKVRNHYDVEELKGRIHLARCVCAGFREPRPTKEDIFLRRLRGSITRRCVH
jgi:hypothetical protein